MRTDEVSADVSPMNPETVHRKLQQFPRLHFCHLPTPLEPLERLSNQLGGPRLWVKRDDGVGPGLGGNKGRNLEYLMADALKKGRHKVVTFGGLQSNHTRMTAAACAALGLQAHLFHFERRPATFSGNLLLSHLFGARLHFVPFGGGREASMTIERTNRLVRLLSAALVGPRAYFIPVGGHCALGGLGYVNFACELMEQLDEQDLNPAKTTLVTAVGSGGTLAALMASFKILDLPVRILGIDVGRLWKDFPTSLARLAGEICDILGQPHHFTPAEVPMIESAYVGPGYARLTEASQAAIRRLARSEGILLDPVYTGKAFAGLLDLYADFDRDEVVIFLHTGGAPSLWAFDEPITPN